MRSLSMSRASAWKHGSGQRRLTTSEGRWFRFEHSLAVYSVCVYNLLYLSLLVYQPTTPSYIFSRTSCGPPSRLAKAILLRLHPDVRQLLDDPRQEHRNCCGVLATALEVVLDLRLRPARPAYASATLDSPRWRNGWTHLVVSVILVPSALFSARNWIIWPEDNGREGLYVGGFALSYPRVRSRTLVMVKLAIVGG